VLNETTGECECEWIPGLEYKDGVYIFGLGEFED